MLLREALGDVLRRLRTGQGRTINEVATAASVSTPYLSELERGRKDASSEVLATIATALETRLDLLMFEVADAFDAATTASRTPTGSAIEPGVVTELHPASGGTEAELLAA